MSETKHDKFRRLAKMRGERILNDLRLLGNLSSRSNYDYSDEEVRRLFSSIEEELRSSKQRFAGSRKRGIEL